jgi:L-fuculokinase
MTSQKAYLVLDIGKTNKKILVYDLALSLLYSKSIEIGVINRDDLELEDTDSLLQWLSKEISAISNRYHFNTMAISCHGAAFALLDKKGDLCFPVISYTSKMEESFFADFTAEYGRSEKLLLETGTPDLGFINIGKGLHYLKTFRPEEYALARTFLFYTQYFGYLFTNQTSLEYTYLGNHSYLWDFQKSSYSNFAKQVGIRQCLPENIQKPWEVLGVLNKTWKKAFGIEYDLPVTVGIHDSNGALLPYLLKGMKNSVLLSTGSWCVGMIPALPYTLSSEDIEANTFYNIDSWGRPLRTSIFTGGLEFAAYDTMFGKKDLSNKETLKKLLSENNLFILPGLIKGTCVFPGCVPAIIYKDEIVSFENMPAFIKNHYGLIPLLYTAISVSLGIQAIELFKRLQVKSGGKIFIEGGFLKNEIWCETIMALRNDLRYFVTNLQEASAFGAGLTALIADRQIEPKDAIDLFEMQSELILPKLTLSFTDYQKKYVENLTKIGVNYVN